MAAQQHKSSLTWIVIGLITVAVVALAFWMLRPTPTSLSNETVPTEQLDGNTNAASGLTGQSLKEAIATLAIEYEVAITLDNPYMEDCPYPASLSKETSFKHILMQLTKHYKMELHEAAPGEYLLIGGTCE